MAIHKAANKVGLTVGVTDHLVEEKAGDSDHYLTVVKFNVLSPLLRKRERIFSKARATLVLSDVINDMNLEQRTNQSSKRVLRMLSAKLRRTSLIKRPKPTNYFKTIQFVEDELKKERPDSLALNKLISRNKSLTFCEYLTLMVSLKRQSKLREFHRILGSLLHLKKSGSVVTELVDPLNRNELLTTSESMAPILIEKYG